MDLVKLNKGNQLRKQINEYEAALDCFEYKYGEKIELTYDRTPQIILNVDDLDGGRENLHLPMALSDEIINVLKSEIHKNLAKLKKDFKEL